MEKTRTVLGLIIPVIFTIIVSSVNVLATEPDGKALYTKSCQTCHAVDGKGNTKLAAGMKIDPALLNLIDDETTKKTDADLMKVIQNGNGKMKGFKDKLSQEEVTALVKYILSLKK